MLATRGEENAVNYYAADSGIEDALYGLTNNQSYEQKEYILEYTNSGLNNRIVNISVVNNPGGLGNTTYKITSTATHNKSGASTKIESYIRATPLKFWEFGQDAITSNCSVTIHSGSDPMINGSVTYVCDDGLECPGSGCNIVPPNESMQDSGGIDWWPETWAIAQYFRDEAEKQGAVHMTGDVEIDVADLSYEISEPPYNGNLESLGPLYVDGDLEIKSSVNGASASLEGIVYITGDLNIGGTTGVNRDFTLNLNDQAIFVENKDAIIGGTKYNQGHAEVVINDHCTFTGSGAIFAIGDIYFAPKLLTTADEFIFVMSLEGWVNMQPGGDFYGSIAGKLHVDINPNNKITRTDGGDFWNTFFDPEPVILKILTYDIVDR